MNRNLKNSAELPKKLQDMKNKQEHIVLAMMFNVEQVDVPVYRYNRY